MYDTVAEQIAVQLRPQLVSSEPLEGRGARGGLGSEPEVLVPGGGIEPPTSGPDALQIMSLANPARAGALPAEPSRRRSYGQPSVH